MAYGATGYRDNWLRNAINTAGTELAAVETVAPHDFVGAQSGYGGVLTQHGEFCRRVSMPSSSDCALRYFSAQQAKEDTAPCEVQCAFITHAASDHVGLSIKVPATGHAEGNVVCPAPSGLVDDDFVTLPDGTTTVTFWIDKSGTNPRTWDATNVRWLVQGLTTAVEVADALRVLVEAATNLNLTTDEPGVATVRTTNRAHNTGNVAITASAAFTVTGMTGGSNTISTNQGYCLHMRPSGSSRLWLSRCGSQFWSGGAYNNLTSGIVVDNWFGLKLSAHRVGEAVRLKGYYMVGHTLVDLMYVNPTWTQAFDLLHVNGDSTVHAATAVSGQVAEVPFANGTANFAGKAGFCFFNSSSTQLSYVSSLRISRDVSL